MLETPNAPPPPRGRLRRLIGNPWTFQFALAAGLLSLAAAQVNFADVGRAFRDASYAWLILVIVIYALSRVVHTWEWQMTLTKVGHAPFGGMFGAMLIGSLVNAVVPASAGDVAKVQIVANRYGLTRAGLIAGRGAESLVNAIIMVMFIAVSFTLPGTGFASANVLVLLALGCAAIFIAAAVASRVLPRAYPRWRVFGVLPRGMRGAVEDLWPRVHDGFELIRQPRLLVLAILLNLFGWLVDVTILWAYGQAFNLDVPFGAYLSVAVAVAIITTFPITFGNIGTFEFALLRVLALYNVSPDAALAFAVGTHVFMTAFNIALGLGAMLVMRISPREVFSLRSHPLEIVRVPAPVEIK